MLAGADAVGLNFYEQSKRCVSLELADQIVKHVPSHVAKVGLFVNSSIEEILEIDERLQLDYIQLHGDEPAAVIAELARRPVVKAFRCGRSKFAQIGTYLSECRNCGHLPAAILIDAHQPGLYGGTGKVVDWKLVVDARESFAGIPVVLAGGLTPFNVAEAISVVSPVGVDTASGVESKPGHPDPLLLRAFVVASKQAFSNLGPEPA